MSRRSFIVALSILALVTLTVSVTLYALLHYEPEIYRQAAVPAGEQRAKLSEEFLREFFSFRDSIISDREGWFGEFSDERINSYLDESFVRFGLGDKILPDGISDPRIIFESNRLHLAFRYRSRLINTVVSITARIWLPQAEPNVLAVQIQGFRAGAIPFTAQWLLERISDSARQNGIEVNWYRHEGFPVALLRFQADQARPSIQLTAIQLEKGKLTVHGRSTGDRLAAP